MTPEVQLALVAAIVPTIAAIGAIVVVIAGNRHADRKADVIVAKTEAIAVKAEEIHTTSNGHLTAVTAALAAANEKINSLEKLVTAMVTAKK